MLKLPRIPEKKKKIGQQTFDWQDIFGQLKQNGPGRRFESEVLKG